MISVFEERRNYLFRCKGSTNKRTNKVRLCSYTRERGLAFDEHEGFAFVRASVSLAIVAKDRLSLSRRN